MDLLRMVPTKNIYKIGADNLFWGDVDMVGESAFNPVLHIGYTLTPWFTIEGTFGISFSEYLADITNRFNMDLRTGFIFPDPELGEFDAEHRSLVTMNVGEKGVAWRRLRVRGTPEYLLG